MELFILLLFVGLQLGSAVFVWKLVNNRSWRRTQR
jgi:hypothetical protein